VTFFCHSFDCCDKYVRNYNIYGVNIKYYALRSKKFQRLAIIFVNELFRKGNSGSDVRCSKDGIFKPLRSLGIDSANLCSLADRYDNPIPTRLSAPIDSSKIPAQVIGHRGILCGSVAGAACQIQCNDR
jgi:hypothetical protein